MMKSSKASKLALLRRYAPNTQALADVPAHPPKRRAVEDTGLRLQTPSFLWDDEAWDHLGPQEVMRTSMGRHVIVARDAAGGDRRPVKRSSSVRQSRWGSGSTMDMTMKFGCHLTPAFSCKRFYWTGGVLPNVERRQPAPNLTTSLTPELGGCNAR